MITKEFHCQSSHNEKPTNFLNLEFSSIFFSGKFFEVFNAFNYHADDYDNESNSGDCSPNIEP